MFTGCGTALVTPFKKDLSLDEATLRSLVQRQIDAGINFLVPCGTTGESPTLTRAEHLRVVKITVEEGRGRGPLPGASTEIPAEMAQIARESLAGNFAAARDIQRKFLPLMNINFVESNPIPVKAAMALMGLLEPVWRLPMVPPSPSNLAKIQTVLDSVGLLQHQTA